MPSSADAHAGVEHEAKCTAFCLVAGIEEKKRVE